MTSKEIIKVLYLTGTFSKNFAIFWLAKFNLAKFNLIKVLFPKFSKKDTLRRTDFTILVLDPPPATKIQKIKKFRKMIYLPFIDETVDPADPLQRG